MNYLEKKIKNKNLLKFITIIQKRYVSSEMSESSTSVAYYLFLSIFPLIITIGNILPFLSIDSTSILMYISEILPKQIYDALESTFVILLEKPDGSLLSISAIGTIWVARKSVNALQNSLNKIYSVPNRSNYIIQQLYSVTMIIFFLITITFVVFVFGLGKDILEYIVPILKISPDIIGTFTTLRWPLTLLLLFILMISIYYFVPNVKNKFRFILPGSILATLSWMMLTQVFSWLVQYFFTRITSYGIFGSVMLFMLWLNFAAGIILIGAILNAGIEEYYVGKIEESESRLVKIIDNQVAHFKTKENK